MIVVTTSAVPTAVNAEITASLAFNPSSLRANWYLDRKCTLSSTTIPRANPVTTETAKLTWPTSKPQTPNANAIGKRFGTD